MSWYWIIGALVFAILRRENKDMEPFFAFASMFWPLIIVSYPLAFIVLVVDKLVDKFYKRKGK